MAAGNVHRIIRGPGRVVINPTDEFDGNTYPYGGTQIGKTMQCVLAPQGRPLRVEYESLGEAGEILEPNKAWTFGCVVRGWDDDAIEALFTAEHYVAGSVSGHAVYVEPGTRVPGEKGTGRAVTLAYIPDDTIHVPAVLIYAGVPDWSETAELWFERNRELGLPLVVDCLRDSNDNILRIGRLPDLELTP